MRVLISGAGGFCGRHLVRYAAIRGAEVHTLGPRPTSDRHHLADLTDEAAVTAAILEGAPDAIFHLAGVSVSPDLSAYYRVNTQSAAVLFRSFERARCRCPVLVVGSSAEYGIPEGSDLPLSEEHIGRPYNHYGISKLAQTSMALQVAVAGHPVVVARPFNILGPDMPEHGAVCSFATQISQAIKGRREPVVRVGNLGPSRDFVHVDDVVRIYWRLLEQPSAYGRIVNVCTGVGTSLAEILAALTAAAGIPIEVRIDPALVKPIEIERHFGSTTRLRAILGESPAPPTRSQIVDVLEHLNGTL